MLSSMLMAKTRAFLLSASSMRGMEDARLLFNPFQNIILFLTSITIYCKTVLCFMCSHGPGRAFHYTSSHPACVSRYCIILVILP